MLAEIKGIDELTDDGLAAELQRAQELGDEELAMVAGGIRRPCAGIDLQKADSPTGTPVAKLHW